MNKVEQIREQAQTTADTMMELLAEVSLELRQLRKTMESAPTSIGVSDDEVDAPLEVNFPVPGARRALIRRTPDGLIAAVAVAPAVILPANNRRLGGTIVNKGSVGVTLYLGRVVSTTGGASAAGAGQVWLGPNGGSWDFRLGNLAWCGNISAAADSATSTLAIAEV